MSVEEFYRLYAERCGIDSEVLANRGRRAWPCYCGEDGCLGWQMLPEDCPPVGVNDLGYAPTLVGEKEKA